MRARGVQGEGCPPPLYHWTARPTAVRFVSPGDSASPFVMPAQAGIHEFSDDLDGPEADGRASAFRAKIADGYAFTFCRLASS